MFIKLNQHRGLGWEERDIMPDFREEVVIQELSEVIYEDKTEPVRLRRNAIILRSGEGRRGVTLYQVGSNITAHFDETHFCVVKDLESIANININDTIILGESISNALNV